MNVGMKFPFQGNGEKMTAIYSWCEVQHGAKQDTFVSHDDQ